MTFACNTLSGTRRTVRDRVCSACRQHKAHQFPSFHHAQVSLALTRPKHETRSCRRLFSETPAPLQESENVLPPLAKANVSMHGTPHVGFLLHMHPGSRWLPCAANAALGTSAEVALNLHDIETSPFAWLEMFVHHRINIVQGVCSFTCTTILATVSRISFVHETDLPRNVFTNLINMISIRCVRVGSPRWLFNCLLHMC